jgi:hypothetical protein
VPVYVQKSILAAAGIESSKPVDPGNVVSFVKMVAFKALYGVNL